VQIKSINYVEDVQKKVFDRMVSEREQIAEQYREEGQKVFAEFRGRIEKERHRILSEAYRQAETIKGEAEAARIYAEASGRDPEFYSFWRTLEIYRKHLSENISLVISTDSDFFKYLRSAGLPAGP
jgi:membrane protease subunit HflC